MLATKDKNPLLQAFLDIRSKTQGEKTKTQAQKTQEFLAQNSIFRQIFLQISEDFFCLDGFLAF